MLAEIGSVASLVSLILTSYIALGLRRIRNTYIFRAKAPQFVRALSKHASVLIEYANDFDNSRQQIGIELARSEVKLRTMQRRMHGEPKKAVIRLRASIKQFEQDPSSKEKFYSVYREMQGVVEEVKELREGINLE